MDDQPLPPMQTPGHGSSFWKWLLTTGEGRVFVIALVISLPAYLSYEMHDGSGFYYWLSFPHSLRSLTQDFELWRLVSPAFLHFSLMHLLMNFIAFYWLLLNWPAQWSLPRLIISLVCIAVVSNISQYFWAGSAFGGLSGVVFGLAGIYIGGVATFRLRPVKVAIPVLSFQMIAMLLLMLVLGFGGVVKGLADMAHLAGLLSGIIAGALLVLLSPIQQPAGRSF